MTTCPTRRGGTIPELLAGAAALALLAALILPAAARMRAESRTASSLSQLRWIAGATNSYAADNADEFWTFSWKAGVRYPFRGITIQQSTDIRAATYQAIAILDRLGGRPDIQVPTAWIPHPFYSHLPLADYVGGVLPNFSLVSPADKYRLMWARDPRDGFDKGKFLPYQPEPTPENKRWPYSSSYMPPTTFWDPDDRFTQGSSHRSYGVPSGAPVGGAMLTDVAYPSQKVIVHDQEQRDLGGGGLYCVDPHARTAVLMGDGSAAVRATTDANKGWRPAQPTSASPTEFFYQWSPWEPPAGPSGARVTGHYRWTRGGIAGRDFGGPEVDTGQP